MSVGVATPSMTSNTAPSGVVSSSGDYSGSYLPYMAFCNRTLFDWISDVAPSVETPCWLQYQFGAGVTVRAFSFVTRNNVAYTYPQDFKLQGSTNGSDWTDLYAVTGLTDLAQFESTPIYEIASPAEYTYYRLSITALTDEGTSAWVAVEELRLYQDGKPAIPFMTDYEVPTTALISASSELNSSYKAWQAFQPLNPERYCWISASTPSVGSPQWLQVQLDDAVQVEFFRFQTRDFSTSLSNPEDFKLQGSNNGSDWTDLATITGLTGLTNHQNSPYYEVTSPSSYTYYRLYITKANGVYSDSWVAVGHLELCEAISAGGGTTYQVACADGFTAADTPTKRAIFSADCADGMSAADSDGGTATLTATLAETLNLSDSAAKALVMALSVSDGFIAADTTTRAATYQGAATDGTTAAAAVAATATYRPTAAEGIAMSASALRSLRLLMSCADGVTISDSGTPTMTFSATCADGAEFAETLATVMRFVASCSDGFEVSDSPSVPVGITAYRTVSVTFRTSKATIVFSVARPSVTFAVSKPTITFN